MKKKLLGYAVLILALGLSAKGLVLLLAPKPNLENYQLALSEQQRLSLVEQFDLEVLSDISVKNYIFVYGHWEPLFKTFDDREVALFRLKEVIPEYLQRLREKGNLEELSRWNWKKYFSISLGLNFSDGTAELRMKQYFESFIDIYENNCTNYWTEVEFNRLSKRHLDPNGKQYKQQLYMLLPSNSELSNELLESIKSR